MGDPLSRRAPGSGAGQPGPDAEQAGLSDSGQPAAERPAAGRRKRPRVIAPAAHLQARVQLTGSYQKVSPAAAVDESIAKARSAASLAPAAHPASTGGDPLAGLLAKEDDPRFWGDSTADLAEAMKREKPPHWG
ncbi:hypothetical protein [Glutamicibacter sp. NPDC087344]|uniref:hypothetical protein n=1 Tax=Glutamicibacter sp. NPDC087344 TaxID=3363994 RepID=UPI00381B9CB8